MSETTELAPPEPRCESELACNKSTLLWQRMHCKCLIEHEYNQRRDVYDAYIDRRMGWDR
jgi:hypothetical protein